MDTTPADVLASLSHQLTERNAQLAEWRTCALEEARYQELHKRSELAAAARTRSAQYEGLMLENQCTINFLESEPT